jgi:hypothetical protein
VPIVVDSSGQERYVTQEEVPVALQSGYRLKAGERVEVTSEKGVRGSVAADQVPEAFAQSYTPTTGSVLKAEDDERYFEGKYGGLSGRSLLEGAARGATLGLSDIALVGLGADREGLQQRRERGIGTGVAELGGAILPGLFTGGAGAGASAARLLPAGRAAVAGANAAKAAGGGIRGLVAQGAAEGAMFTAGQSVSDLTLSDDPVTAEALVAEAGDVMSGVVLGAAVGGALGVGGKLVKRLGDRSKRFVNEADHAASMEAPIIEREAKLSQLKQRKKDLAFSKGTERQGRVQGRANEVLEIETDIATRQATKRAKMTEAAEVGEPLAQSFRGSLDTLEAEAKKTHGVAKKLSRFGGERPKELSRAYDDFLAAETKYRSLVGSDDVLRGNLGRNIDEVHDAIRDYERKTVNLANEVNLGQGADAITLLPGATLDDVYGELVSPVHHLDRAGDDGIEALFGGKRGRPTTLGKADSEIDTLKAKLRELKAGKASEPAIKLDPEIHALDQQISKEMLAVKLMKEARRGKPVPVDLLDMLAIADEGGEAVGVDPIAGPAGALLKMRSLGRHAAGFASMMPGKLGRAAGWVANGPLAISGTKQAFHQRVASAVDGLMKAKGAIAKAAPAAAVVAESSHDRFKKRMQDVNWAMGNPDAHERMVWDRLAPVRAVDVRLADQMIGVEKRKAAFLHAKAPKNPGVGNILQGKDKWQPSAEAQAKLLRAAAVVDDPLVAFARAQEGRLTRDDVEALKFVYPEAYQAMRLELMGRVAEIREELPYAKRVQLSVFFGVPVDSIMKPEMVRSIQDAHASAEAGEAAEATASQETGSRGGHTKAANFSRVTPPEPTRAQRMGAL